MAAIPLSKELAQEALDAVAAAGNNKLHAAAAMGVSPGCLYARLRAAGRYGLVARASAAAPTAEAALKQQVRVLKAELGRQTAETLDADAIRAKIIGLKKEVATAKQPPWMLETQHDTSSPGVPTLFLSDLHWGEVVNASQVMGKNSYNLATAHARMQSLVQDAVHLLKIVSPKLDYPGIVVPLGGDMISGNIHEELAASNEINSMPAVLDLYGALVKVISHLADVFGAVFLPCVTGNHGRDTRKIWAKDRHHTNFDWLLYCFLAKHFEDDKRVTFLIPDGSDAYYRVYEHRYLLTHGDQFRGGDGMIGALGPIIRGDHKKRSRNAQVGLDYDTLICGHWHQYIHLNRLIVNGSLKGYDEFAYIGNFPFEPPQQALWLTHPRYRITYRMPVYVDKKRPVAKTSWVSVTK